jgi:transposase
VHKFPFFEFSPRKATFTPVAASLNPDWDSRKRKGRAGQGSVIDSLLERVTAAAEERQLSHNSLLAYRRTWLKIIAWAAAEGLVLETLPSERVGEFYEEATRSYERQRDFENPDHVERSFAWAARFRRLAKDYERLPSSVAGLHWLAFLILMLNSIFHQS